MIQGIHGMFYSSQPKELREFLRDKLQLPAHDVGEGWLIFDFSGADMGVHPTDFPGSPPSGTHNVSFYCDDIEQTVADMKERGVEFIRDIRDDGFGLTIEFKMPGDVIVQLYQKKYC
ncbi:MAG: VOC family protein [Planctomycetota bacterium]